jgi:hypothetical protein
MATRKINPVHRRERVRCDCPPRIPGIPRRLCVECARRLREHRQVERLGQLQFDFSRRVVSP